MTELQPLIIPQLQEIFNETTKDLTLDSAKWEAYKRSRGMYELPQLDTEDLVGVADAYLFAIDVIRFYTAIERTEAYKKMCLALAPLRTVERQIREHFAHDRTTRALREEAFISQVQPYHELLLEIVNWVCWQINSDTIHAAAPNTKVAGIIQGV